MQEAFPLALPSCKPLVWYQGLMGQERIGNLPMLSMALLGAVWVLTLYVHSLCGFVEISTCIFLIYFFSSFFLN